MASAYKDMLRRRIEAAQGIIPCDLVLKNCRIVDVYTQSVREGDIAVIDGVLAGIGGSYEGRRVVDAGGRYAAPGLIDSHIHIESSYVSPEEFGRLVVPLGMTTIIADPHEIANVCGLAGLQYMAEAAEQTVLDIQFMAPSCVPATSFDHSGAVIGAEELARALQDRHILGVGEFMNYPGVTAAQDDVLDKLAAAHEAGKLVDGHSPGLHGGGLQAYAAAGIRTDHECSTTEEALERISLGMYVLLRNGSACRDLPNLIGAVTPQNLRRFLLCSDDLHLKTIFSKGHLNEHLRLCVRYGISPEGAVTMATLNAAECYGLSDRGALAPGKRADVVLFDDLQEFSVWKTFIAGEEAASEGAYIPPFTRADTGAVRHTVHLASFSAGKLRMTLSSPSVHTIDIIPGSVVTRKGTATVAVDERGDFVYDAAADIVKVAVVERHHGTGNVGLGLLRGYGLTKGAVAVSIAHDSHNIIVAGANNGDMAAAVEAVAAQEGGIAVVLDGAVIASMPLPIAGLMSDRDGHWVEAQAEEIYAAGHEVLGIHEDVDVVMTLCFMSLPVIPQIKLLDTGLFDVDAFSFTDIEAE